MGIEEVTCLVSVLIMGSGVWDRGVTSIHSQVVLFEMREADLSRKLCLSIRGYIDASLLNEA